MPPHLVLQISNEDDNMMPGHEEYKHGDDGSEHSSASRRLLLDEDPLDGDDSSPSAPLEHDYDPTQRVYSYEQLSVLNLVVHPIWIFDYVERRMRWANNAGLKMWNAQTLEELQMRSFQDISEASAKRMEEYLIQFARGMNVTDQWTNYPNGKATTCHMNVSGIKFSQEEDHFCVMCEGVPLVKEELLHDNLRGVEMIRHLPMAVCQFDMEGKLMFQNPEASMTTTSGATAAGTSSSSLLSSSSQHRHQQQHCREEECKQDPTESAAVGESHSHHTRTPSTPAADDFDRSTRSSSTNDSKRGGKAPGSLLQRFADPDVGRQVLSEIQSQSLDKIDMEAMIKTRMGCKWSAIQLRKGKDPVTGDPVILYSASDKSDAVRAREERKAREQKSEFLAIMAHEIRTPLHQVTGFIDLLDQTRLDPEQKSFVRLLKSSAQGLMTVISDVLDYSKLEAGKMKLEWIPYEPLSVVEGSLAAVRASCEENNLFLNLEWSKGIPYKLKGDPNRLRQILLNLLSNAVKFTKQGGISVKALPVKADPSTSGNNGPMVRFEISDTGMGISAEHKNIIFRKYQQANAAVARNFGGTGLGLSICQSLSQNMGGTIGVESELGHGATFWVTLPADIPAEADMAERAEDDPTEFSRGLHILVAEDNKVNQKLLANMLKRMGHTSEIAFNGKKAIEMLEENPNGYDVILMDIQMPVMDGLEATRRIRSMGYADLPIFGLTASVTRSDFSELGLDDWLPKPIPMKELRSKLHRLQGHSSSPEHESPERQ
jgi:signal transduction histidine kinase/ActR/RegA family two-component response regulator